MKTRLLKWIRNEKNEQLSDPIVYKYCSMNKFLKNLLVDNSMFFNNPYNFNDPFDCNLVINNEVKKEDIKSYYDSNRWSGKKKDDPLIKDIFDSKFTNIPAFEKRFRQEYNAAIGAIGISCFCQDKQNLLLWAHYADKHTGVCLAFDTSADTEFFSLLKKVKYADRYPVFQYIENKNMVLENLLLKKSRQWKYEQEIRLIKPKSCSVVPFAPKALKAIYFGMRVEDAFVKYFDKLLIPDKYGHVEFYTTKQKDRLFDLDFTIYPRNFGSRTDCNSSLAEYIFK
jgi:DUF2971 family protein